MNYEIFRQSFVRQKIITLDDILVRWPEIDRKQLTRWSEQGRLIHPARWIYVLPMTQCDEMWLRVCANTLVKPSYISLEYALSYYWFIPEEVTTLTCITTKKTQSYDLHSWWRYSYRSIVPRAFVGYQVHHITGETCLIATPVKALLDFCYYHPDYSTVQDFEEMRLSPTEVLEKMTLEDLRSWAKIFCNSRLRRQIETLISYLQS